jgi:uncharacterized protein YndB with AHSA1/START domain
MNLVHFYKFTEEYSTKGNLPKLFLMPFLFYLIIAGPKFNENFQSKTIADSLNSQIMNKSFVSSNGERFLRLQLTVNAPIDKVWKAFATEEGMKTWMTPVVKADFRIGGSVKTNYDKNAKIEDKGTITLGIINYIPDKLITYKVSLTDTFPEKCREEDQNLQEIVQFHSLSKNNTKIVSTMIGWGKGKEWDDTYSFFEKGNKWSYEHLIRRFKSGAIKWK